MTRLNETKSPFAAVSDVLSQAGIETSNVLVMSLIAAVRDTTPPPREITIALLSKILRSLSPTSTIDAWAARASQQIVQLLSELPAVQNIAELVNNDEMWCMLEGTIAGMLINVCHGEKLHPPNNEVSPPTEWANIYYEQGRARAAEIKAEELRSADHLPDHLPDHDPGYTTRRGQDGAPMPQAEFLAYFRNAHGALHRRWTLAVAQPGYDKRDWMILDNALSRFGRLVANQIGLDPTERLL